MSRIPIETFTDAELMEHGLQKEEVARLRMVEEMAWRAREKRQREKDEADRAYRDRIDAEFMRRYNGLSLHQREVYEQADKIRPFGMPFDEMRNSALELAERSPLYGPHERKRWQFWKA